jgi:hypothetical protein
MASFRLFLFEFIHSIRSLSKFLHPHSLYPTKQKEPVGTVFPSLAGTWCLENFDGKSKPKFAAGSAVFPSPPKSTSDEFTLSKASVVSSTTSSPQSRLFPCAVSNTRIKMPILIRSDPETSSDPMVNPRIYFPMYMILISIFVVAAIGLAKNGVGLPTRETRSDGDRDERRCCI